MGQKSKELLEVRPLPKSKRSSSRSPKPKDRKKTAETGVSSYGSDGVKNYDIFSLSTSDYRLLGIVTIIAAIVRLFRIYQPSSVVFDEVQYVPHYARYMTFWLTIWSMIMIVSGALRPNTSRAGSSWMSILL